MICAKKCEFLKNRCKSQLYALFLKNVAKNLLRFRKNLWLRKTIIKLFACDSQKCVQVFRAFKFAIQHLYLISNKCFKQNTKTRSTNAGSFSNGLYSTPLILHFVLFVLVCFSLQLTQIFNLVIGLMFNIKNSSAFYPNPNHMNFVSTRT